LVYQSIFAYLSDGNIIAYRSVPSLYKNASASSIARVDIIQPTEIELSEYTNISTLNISSWNELIRRARYTYNTGFGDYLEPSNLVINCIDATRRDGSMILSRSPLNKAIRPINNLLAAYSARYNVYVNNGMAGLLVRKASGGDKTLAEAVKPSDRKKILEDLNDNYGLTGNRNRWGIKGVSGVPIEFVKTISSISELMPFEETLEDSIKVAGVYQIPSGLIPRKDQSTFDNQASQEKAVWENAIMSIADSFGRYWASVCMVDKLGYSFKPDYSTVSCLESNESLSQDVIAKQLANLKALKELNPNIDITEQTNKILDEYGQG
jgi:hypothetical protein